MLFILNTPLTCAPVPKPGSPLKAGPDPMVYRLIGWLQEAAEGCHAAFLSETREREERVAAEKREVGVYPCVGVCALRLQGNLLSAVQS